MIDRNFVKFLKEQYPKGTRIRLNSMSDPYAPVEPGTEGSVEMVDDAGQLLMKWDNGRTLALIPGEDSFSVLPPKLTTLKLYMPMTVDCFEDDGWGGTEISRCSKPSPNPSDACPDTNSFSPVSSSGVSSPEI